METTVRNISNLVCEAETFLNEVRNTSAERSKKNISKVPGLQMFLLFVRGGGHVPTHQVQGPITVQTLLGHARMNVESIAYELPQGTVVSLAAAQPHDVTAINDSVLLVTHSL